MQRGELSDVEAVLGGTVEYAAAEEEQSRRDWCLTDFTLATARAAAGSVSEADRASITI